MHYSTKFAHLNHVAFILVMATITVTLHPQSARGQQPLRDFLESASTNATELQIAAARLKFAHANKHVAIGALLPSLNASATGTLNQYERIRSFPAPLPGNPTNEVSVVLQAKTLFNGNVGVALPLVDLAAWARVRQMNFAEASAEYGQAIASLTVELETIGLWYQLVASHAVVAAAEQNFEVAQASKNDTEAMVEAGSAAPLARARALTELSRAIGSIENAKLQRDVAARSLFDISGLEPAGDVVALSADITDVDALEVFLNSAQNHPTVLAANAAQRASHSGRNVARLALAPRVSASLVETYTSNAGFVGINSQWMLGLNASWNLDYGTGAQIAATKAQDKIAALQEVDGIKAVRSAIYNAWHQLRAARAQLEAAEVAASASEAAADDARIRFREGAGTQLEQIEAGRDAFEAKVNAIQAMANVATARSTLILQSGREFTPPSTRHVAEAID